MTVFKDVNTPSPFIEKFPVVEGEGAKAALPDHIYLDSMGFGMGMSCLQVTFINCCLSDGVYFSKWGTLQKEVDNTKSPCCTLPPTQHHGFFRSLHIPLTLPDCHDKGLTLEALETLRWPIYFY